MFPTSSIDCNVVDNELNDQISHNITIVSAYFNLGVWCCKRFGPSFIRTPHHYLDWMKKFAYIKNPMVLYSDDANFISGFLESRRNLPTKVQLINRSDLYSFSLIEEMVKVLENVDLHGLLFINRHIRDPNYCAAMHAKFELLNRSLNENEFNSSYFAWMDIGLYRDGLPYENMNYTIRVPPNFDENKVAFGEVSKFEKQTKVEEIIHRNKVWVSGAVVFAKTNEMLKFCAQYFRTVEQMLVRGLMSTDQQMVYAMFSDDLLDFVSPQTNVQTYRKILNKRKWAKFFNSL